MAHFNGAKNLHILFLVFTFEGEKLIRTCLKSRMELQKRSYLLLLLVFYSLFAFLSHAVVLEKAVDNT